MTKEEIIKEFYVRFGDERRGLDRNQPNRIVNLREIETFWLSKLQAQKQDLLEKSERKLSNY